MINQQSNDHYLFELNMKFNAGLIHHGTAAHPVLLSLPRTLYTFCCFLNCLVMLPLTEIEWLLNSNQGKLLMQNVERKINEITVIWLY